MLVSHRKQFIFTKTMKTAGTSVESYFEQFCMPSGTWRETHFRDATISEAGIIGYRGPNRGEAIWYNHMPAQRIRDLVGQDVWSRYFKFTIVRNPFDKMVSAFSMVEYRKLHGITDDIGGVDALNNIDPWSHVAGFRDWVHSGGVWVDRNVYLIQNEECLDYYIRYEELLPGIAHVCERLGIPYEPERLPRFKMGYRRKDLGISDYYDAETREVVARLYAWELDRFGYVMPK